MIRARTPRSLGPIRLTRRDFSRLAGTVTLGAAWAPRLAWAQSEAAPAARPKSLVFVHLRGGADGLGLVVPHADSSYLEQRTRTRIDTSDSALELGQGLRLHSSAAGLHAWFTSGELEIFPAIGFRGRPRGHAEAEQRLWAAFARRVAPDSLLRLDARQRPFPGWSLAGQLDHLAERIGNDSARAVAWVEHGGWDTHSAQSSRLADQVSELDAALARFRSQLGSARGEVVIAVASELGRSLSENTTSGTDDGHAGVAFLLGPRRDGGGRVHGRWSLRAGEQARDLSLAPQTDLDAWIAALIDRHVERAHPRSGVRP